MSSIDYGFKSYILNEHKDLLIAQKRCSMYEYAKRLLDDEGIVSCALKMDKYKKGFNDYYDALFQGNSFILNECYKINHAEYERTKRLKHRVRTLLKSGPCIFLTLTFTDDTLAKTTAKQRRVAVSRYLKSYQSRYVANIDFGADKTKTMREHYHALICCEKVNRDGWKKYGAINFKRVRLKRLEDDYTKLSKYIAKLSNHAIKETAKRGALLYSR